MNHDDLLRIAEQFKAQILVRLRAMNKKYVEENPRYEKTFGVILDGEEWAVNDAWEEVFGHDNSEGK